MRYLSPDILEEYGDVTLTSDTHYKSYTFFEYEDDEISIYIEVDVETEDQDEKYEMLYECKTLREIHDEILSCYHYEVEIRWK